MEETQTVVSFLFKQKMNVILLFKSVGNSKHIINNKMFFAWWPFLFSYHNIFRISQLKAVIDLDILIDLGYG